MPLTKWRVGRTQNGFGKNGLILLDGDDDRLVSLVKREDGQIVFQEECDGYFTVELSKDDAKQALREAMDWIEGDKE